MPCYSISRMIKNNNNSCAWQSGGNYQPQPPRIIFYCQLFIDRAKQFIVIFKLNTKRKLNISLCFLIILSCTPKAYAEDTSHNKKEPPATAVVWPLTTIGAPSAFGLDQNRLALGLSGTECQWDGCQPDARMFISLGLGNAKKWLGTMITASINSINPTDGGFADHGDFYFKFFHVFEREKLAIAVGLNRILSWKRSNQAPIKSYYYISTTRYFLLQPQNKYNPLPTTVTLGFGNGLLAADDNFWDPSYPTNGHNLQAFNSYSPFFGIGLQFIPKMGITSDVYANGIFNVLLNIIPLEKKPLRVNIGVSDIFTQNPRQKRLSIIGGVGFGVSLY